MKVNSLHPECVLEILVIVLKYKAGEIIEEREDASFHPSIRLCSSRKPADDGDQVTPSNCSNIIASLKFDCVPEQRLAAQYLTVHRIIDTSMHAQKHIPDRLGQSLGAGGRSRLEPAGRKQMGFVLMAQWMVDGKLRGSLQ